jgi:ADP-ribosylglycohydrolase
VAALPSLSDRGAGALLGLALGDALGAKLEGGILSRAIWFLVCIPYGSLLRWTDDTQMSLGAAESLLDRGGVDCDDLARRWAAAARWSRGYGPGTLALLAQVRRGRSWQDASKSVFREGSYGNGAAMRSAPFGLFYRGRRAELLAAAAEAARVTHAHPLGVEGAVLIAAATADVLEGAPLDDMLDDLEGLARREEFRSRLKWARAALNGTRPDAREVRRALGRGIAAHESVVTAIYAFARHRDDFGALTAFVAELGGDVDTIGAMAGALCGARNGVAALPAEPLSRLEERDRLDRLGRALVSRERK